MKAKTGFIVGIAVGWFIGTAQGRDLVSRTKERAQDIWDDPRVQDQISNWQEQIKQAKESI